MQAFGALFFVSFMFLGSLIILILFIGVIMSGMEEAQQENELARREYNKQNNKKNRQQSKLKKENQVCLIHLKKQLKIFLINLMLIVMDI